MDRIPQSSQLNPAIQPRSNLYIGLPGISSIELNAGNNSYGLFNLFTHSSANDSLYAQINNVLGSNKNGLILYANSHIDLISFGFRVNDSYFTFAISERMEMTMNVPRDLFRLIINGTDTSANNFNLNNLGTNATWWREYSIGYSNEIDDQLTLGMRFKVLFGKANVSSSSTIDLYRADISEWAAQTNVNVNSSIPGMQLYYNQNGNIDSLKEQNQSNLKANQILGSVYNPRNNVGLAMDLGFIYKPVKMLSISAGLLDLGYINWRSNLNNLSYSGSYKVQGAPVSLSDTMNLEKSLLDSLKNFPYQHNQNNYLTTLSPKLYVGFHVQPLTFIGAGILERLEVIQGSVEPQTTLSLNLYSSFICMTFSYTLVDGMTDNFGIATNLNFGPLQFYIASDRIPLFWAKNVLTSQESSSNSGLASIPYVPEYYKNFNVHFGINLVFGYDRKKKEETKDITRLSDYRRKQYYLRNNYRN
jgi:hypothetical protein